MNDSLTNPAQPFTPAPSPVSASPATPEVAIEHPGPVNTSRSNKNMKGLCIILSLIIIIPLCLLILFILQTPNFRTLVGTLTEIFTRSNPVSSSVYEFPDTAAVGVKLNYDFSPELITLLLVKNSTSSPPYTFHIGTGAQALPAGLVLSTAGVMSGKPTGTGSTFEVCIQDVSLQPVCRIYRLDVGTTTDNVKNTNIPSWCPTTYRYCGQSFIIGGSIAPLLSMDDIVFDICKDSKWCPPGMYLLNNKLQDHVAPDGRSYARHQCSCPSP